MGVARGTVECAMPTYDYACTSCGTFAATRRIADRDQATDCPKCGRPATRLVSSPHVGGVQSLHARETSDGRYARMRHAGGCGCCT